MGLTRRPSWQQRKSERKAPSARAPRERRHGARSRRERLRREARAVAPPERRGVRAALAPAWFAYHNNVRSSFAARHLTGGVLLTLPSPTVPYTAQRIPQLSRVRLRGLEFQTYRWPGLDHAPVLLLHGWGDTGATWQFVVDHSPRERTYFALDLRGFGRSERPQDGYWFPDYLADVDALIDEVSPHAPIDLVGHSMGGNIALLYAGVRPTRVRRVVSLEGLGLTRTAPEQAPARYAEWLDQVRRGVEFTVYDS